MQIIIASHGSLATGLLESVQMITGNACENVHCLSLTEEGIALFEQAAETLKEEIGDEQVLIFADLYGATPFNVCMKTFRENGAWAVTGANLPMLLETILTCKGKPPEAQQEVAVMAGKDAIFPTDTMSMFAEPAGMDDDEAL